MLGSAYVGRILRFTLLQACLSTLLSAAFGVLVGAFAVRAAEVALAGYRGVMAGRRLVIPGFMNKVGVHAARFAPRILAPRIVRALQSEG